MTGLYAAFTGRRHKHLAFASAFNSGITAATFFTIREYFVSPALAVAVNYSRERSGTEGDKPAVDHLSWSSLRRNNLLDSAISGAATGGILRGLTSGRRTIAPGAFTAGLACVLLQAAYNELDIQRIKYVGKISRPPEISVVPTEAPSKLSLKTRILALLGVKLLSDEELLGKYRRERDIHLKKIQELEQEMEEDRRRNAEK
ncbi:hypothetical protein FB451DRAFT_1056111 [Mycena latifolia]|nr:hypothetical protein FB451DRAFT_1056111 [Mycena latifolia]